ncbi:MAG: HD domain-containing phosphohydrolase [Sphaerochaeta sp.]|nr:response regulator [Sphaerochaeta sp.]
MTRHIVATDDDPAIRKILQIMLTKEGYQVTSCQNGNELISELATEETTIDLILLDIKMPGFSGLDLLAMIKRSHPHIPVIMLTAFSDLDTGMKAMRLGASDYLTKPVRRETLVTCIRRVLAASETQQEEVEEKSFYLNQQKDLEKKLHTALQTLNNTTFATLEAFSETIEQKDAYTKGHCSRVRTIAVSIAKALNLPHSNVMIIEGGSLLHDIGKIGIPETILNKNSSLTKEEYDIIKTHPEAGERIIRSIEMFQPYRPIIRSHHERIDGKGYPDGLKGDEIPLDVKIVSLADAFDAMTSSRAYRSALPTELAVEEIKLFSGTQFDPDLVNLFIDKELFLL